MMDEIPTNTTPTGDHLAPAIWMRNRQIGWMSLAAGAITGLTMGLWSFAGPVPVPSFLGDYDDVARRLARLGHIAFFGLGIINILMAREMPPFSASWRWARVTAWAMSFGNVFLPLTLFAAAGYRPLKYLLPFPALSAALAIVLATARIHHAERTRSHGDPS